MYLTFSLRPHKTPMFPLNLTGPFPLLCLALPGVGGQEKWEQRGLITEARIWRTRKSRPCLDSRVSGDNCAGGSGTDVEQRDPWLWARPMWKIQDQVF